MPKIDSSPAYHGTVSKDSGRISLGLTDLIDLTAQLRLDAATGLDELQRRDGVFTQRLEQQSKAAPLSSTVLVKTWLEHVYAGRPRPGQSYKAALQLVLFVLVVAGLGAGASAANLVLRYDGRTPVNVVEFLAVLVFIQVGLLFLFAGAAFVAAVRRSKPGRTGVLYKALRHAVERTTERISEWKGKQSGPPPRIERWLVLILSQSFGVAFNVAALLTTLYLLSFTDLAFAWSTTLNVSPEQFHAWMEALAVPWRWLEGQAAPSLDVVRQTQYFRFDERYAEAGIRARASDVRLLGAWWPFLVAALITYGLVPRLLLWIAAWVALQLALRQSAPNPVALENLIYRLQGRFVTWHDDDTDGDGMATAITPAASVPPAAAKTNAAVPAVGAAACAAVLWRDVEGSDDDIKDTLRRHFALNVQTTIQAGGLAFDLDGTKTAHAAREHLGRVGAGRSASQGIPRMAVLVAEGEHFDAALKKFLEGLREKLGREALLLIIPVRSRAGRLEVARDQAVLDRWRRQVHQGAGELAAVAELRLD